MERVGGPSLSVISVRRWLYHVTPLSSQAPFRTAGPHSPLLPRPASRLAHQSVFAEPPRRYILYVCS
ncbi:unnamed protein product [Danaus chrysippus]|uniref:(African queen) hypothetical protein n=1 Tax=Danaus chrysippus TaxID=151541 RepID=A0A8J2VSV9_9NEOP|nr:unnamed protein product [Danaus chrysippus]